VPGTGVVEGNPERDHGFKADLAPDHAALLAAAADEALVGAFDGGTGQRIAGSMVCGVVHHVLVAAQVSGQVVEGFDRPKAAQAIVDRLEGLVSKG